jgi:SanA protein
MLSYGILLSVLTGIFIFSCYYGIANLAKEKIYTDIEAIPTNDVALVLGTSKLIRNTYINNYYKYRLDAAAALYHAGKVKHLILSGDNGRKEYDEPSDMQADLIKMGIPEAAMTLDYAGFRTLDSVVRCKEIFGQNKITVVSQPFHNERALFLAQHFDIEAIAFNAQMPIVRKKVLMREYLARCKAVLDVYLLRKKPKFLGKKVAVNI